MRSFCARWVSASCAWPIPSGLDAAEVTALVDGKTAVTGETAQRLGRFFGNSPAFWLGLQNQYDRETAADRLADRPGQAAAGGG